MRKKILSVSLAIIGVALVVLGFIQLNQFITATSLINNLSSSVGSASDVAIYASMFSHATNSVALAMVIDFLFGTVLLIVGIFLYPEK